MATTAAQSPAMLRPIPGRRYDHLFFSLMSVLIAVSVFIGFAPTYFLAGAFRAHLPSPVIHVHAVLFISWILLLIVQTSLVSARRVDVHKRLGIFGFFLACLMVLAGLLAGTNSLARNFAPPGITPLTFYVVPVTDMFCFAVLIFFAFRYRATPAVHKRLILIATISLLTAAFVRFHLPILFLNINHAALASYSFLALLIAYDLWSTRKLQRVTLLASAFVVFVQFGRLPFSQTHLWQSFAAWVQHLVR